MDPSIIQTMGVSEKAAEIYLASLTLGTASVQQIASEAAMKRSTAYSYIEELLSAGLLEKVPLNKRVYYRSTNPEQIQKKLQSRVDAFESHLPELIALRNQQSAKPKIQILEGKKGVRQIYNECVETPLIRAYSYLPDIERIFPNEIQRIAEQMIEQGVRVHELMPDKKETRRTSRRFGAIVGGLYESRMVEGDVFNDMLIYGDVVAILRIHELDLFVVRIEDPTIATSMKTLFDTAWKAGTPYYPKRVRT